MRLLPRECQWAPWGGSCGLPDIMRSMRSYAARVWLAPLLAVASAVAVGCSGGEGPHSPSTPSTTQAGATPRATVYPAAAEGDEQIFFALSCEHGTLTLVTTTRTVIAAIPCDRIPPTEVLERFRGEIVEMEIRDGPPAKLFLRSEAAGSLEFTVENVRVIEP